MNERTTKDWGLNGTTQCRRTLSETTVPHMPPQGSVAETSAYVCKYRRRQKEKERKNTKQYVSTSMLPQRTTCFRCYKLLLAFKSEPKL